MKKNNYTYKKMKNLNSNLSLLKLIISNLIQLFDIKSLFMLCFVLFGLDKLKKICLNSINHQGG